MPSCGESVLSQGNGFKRMTAAGCKNDAAKMVTEPKPPVPIVRQFSRRFSWFLVVVWFGIAAWLSPTAWNFSQRVQGTLTGVKDSPAEAVRMALIKNFSTALAFPTALIWDAKGLPPDEAVATWKKLVDTAKKSPGVSDVYDGRQFLSPWPK